MPGPESPLVRHRRTPLRPSRYRGNRGPTRACDFREAGELLRIHQTVAAGESASAYDPPSARVPWSRRAALVAGAALAFEGGRMIGDLWRGVVRDWAHRPPFRGPWVTVEHGLLYSTVTALICWGVWWAFARMGWMASPGSVLRGSTRSVIRWGVGLGIAVFLLDLAALLGLHALGAMPPERPALGWHPMTGWSFLGNLFSNFYEEWIYRGFLFAVAVRVTSSRLGAAVITSALFAAVHSQYAWALRALIFVSTLLGGPETALAVAGVGRAPGGGRARRQRLLRVKRSRKRDLPSRSRGFHHEPWTCLRERPV
ncbi:MAG: CPBP family intramembrane metalloprotease [Myxococcaceae bacterium]|nr:MAG: CPBP family intramembrane metalloprotease [Myxococcaceae bacterium]